MLTKKITIILLSLFATTVVAENNNLISLIENANTGNPTAQYTLGLRYIDGKVIKQDYKKAKDLFEKAEKQGHLSAAYMLGQIHENGWGVKRDFTAAKNWYEKAGNEEEQYAQYRLGLLYKNGNGVEKNTKTAISWFNKSCKNGYSDACSEASLLKERER